MLTFDHNGKRYINIDPQQFEELGISAADQQAIQQAYRLEALRAERNKRLQACDWTQTLDNPLDDRQRQAWADYRQALRELTDHDSNLATMIWPTPPA